MKVGLAIVAAGLLLLLAPLASAQGSRRKAPKKVGPTVSVVGVPHADVSASVTRLDFGAVASGGSEQLAITLSNSGSKVAKLLGLSIELGGAGHGAAWSVDIGGTTFHGSTGNVRHPIFLDIKKGAPVPVSVTFAPTVEQYDSLALVFDGEFDADAAVDELAVELSGLGGHSGDPYLHVVISSDPVTVDYDGNGSESVALDGSTSHTHEPGRVISTYEWKAGGVPFSASPVTSKVLALGTHTVQLTIGDDALPTRTFADSTVLDVVGRDEIPGVLATYYDASGSSASALLDAVPAKPDFAEVLGTYALGASATVGSSELTGDTMVRFTADVVAGLNGFYDIFASGGVDRRIELDGSPFVGPMFLQAGTYNIEVRYAVDSAETDLPLMLMATLNGGPMVAPQPKDLTHDLSQFAPVINSMPDIGIDAGGNLISIDGLGFFPSSSVTVHWGGMDLTDADFSLLTPTRIEFVSPPGSGSIPVTVETPQGTSLPHTFGYSPTGPVPIDFDLVLTVPIAVPTCAVWGPDRRLYVGANNGQITALEFDDTYASVVSSTTYAGVSSLSNENVLGITFNPYDPPSPVRLYVSHATHFVNGGATFTGPSDYTGQVSMLEGPNFDTPASLITGLPTSNHDHAVNGLVFDHNGDLLISVGSNTNAGVKHPNSGDLPESPLSAAIVKAETSKPGFNGTITYVDSMTEVPNNDQVYGQSVDVAPGVDVAVHAAGVRNAFGLVYTTKKRLYATDNGPNIGFGAASTGPTTETADPFDGDELNLIEYGLYYGQPNRSRGRYDSRQNIYYGSLTGPPSIPGVFRNEVTWVPPSMDGIDEYRAATFQGQIRGEFIVQEFLDDLRHVRLSADGRFAGTQTVISPYTGALGCLTLPGGAIGAINYSSNALQVLTPDDLSAVGLVVHDIFPWRAPDTGGYPFTVSGVGFGTLANTSVTIGGLPAALTRVSATRIEGIVPAQPNPTKALEAVEVTVDQATASLPDAFRYLWGVGQETGDWSGASYMPLKLGEVAAGVIDGILYIVGEPSPATFAYNIYAKSFSTVAARTYAGSHHSAEVVGGKLYLIGGLSNGAEGRVQIYDPVLDQWSLGADMAWAAGSVSTCVIDGLIYAAGGIVSTYTVGNTAVYDPALDVWTPLPGMPDGGRNHTAAGTDGSKFWIFGGRRGGNFVANGFDTVFVYDPHTAAWTTSADVGSSLAPLPQARGGMGKAVWDRGEFYVMGGETLDGPGANGLGSYDRVDVYDPATNTWRLEDPMPTARHGIFPVLFESRVFVPGGGKVSGYSQTTIFDIFTRQ